MADVMPDYKVSQQKIIAQIAAQKAQIENQKLAIMEMSERKRSHETNIQAAYRAIAEYETQLRSLEDAHGKLTDKEYEERKTSL